MSGSTAIVGFGTQAYWAPRLGDFVFSRTFGPATVVKLPKAFPLLAVGIVLPSGKVEAVGVDDIRAVGKPGLSVVQADGSLREPAKQKRARQRRVAREQRELELA